MANRGTIAYVLSLPDCNLCSNAKATYDAALSGGQWAYLCANCYRKYALHSTLGVGKGQMLIVR